MLYPSVDKLLEKVGNRYELVMLIAKRSRELTAGAPTEQTDPKMIKSITKAIHELDEDQITFHREYDDLTKEEIAHDIKREEDRIEEMHEFEVEE